MNIESLELRTLFAAESQTESLANTEPIEAVHETSYLGCTFQFISKGCLTGVTIGAPFGAYAAYDEFRNPRAGLGDFISAGLTGLVGGTMELVTKTMIHGTVEAVTKTKLPDIELTYTQEAVHKILNPPQRREPVPVGNLLMGAATFAIPACVLGGIAGGGLGVPACILPNAADYMNYAWKGVTLGAISGGAFSAISAIARHQGYTLLPEVDAFKTIMIGGGIGIAACIFPTTMDYTWKGASLGAISGAAFSMLLSLSKHQDYVLFPEIGAFKSIVAIGVVGAVGGAMRGLVNDIFN